jgi:hypothetical protein
VSDGVFHTPQVTGSHITPGAHRVAPLHAHGETGHSSLQLEDTREVSECSVWAGYNIYDGVFTTRAEAEFAVELDSIEERSTGRNTSSR